MIYRTPLILVILVLLNVALSRFTWHHRWMYGELIYMTPLIIVIPSLYRVFDWSLHGRSITQDIKESKMVRLNQNWNHLKRGGRSVIYFCTGRCWQRIFSFFSLSFWWNFTVNLKKIIFLKGSFLAILTRKPRKVSLGVWAHIGPTSRFRRD